MFHYYEPSEMPSDQEIIYFHMSCTCIHHEGKYSCGHMLVGQPTTIVLFTRFIYLLFGDLLKNPGACQGAGKEVIEGD